MVAPSSFFLQSQRWHPELRRYLPTYLVMVLYKRCAQRAQCALRYPLLNCSFVCFTCAELVSDQTIAPLLVQAHPCLSPATPPDKSSSDRIFCGWELEIWGGGPPLSNLTSRHLHLCISKYTTLANPDPEAQLSWVDRSLSCATQAKAFVDMGRPNLMSTTATGRGELHSAIWTPEIDTDHRSHEAPEATTHCPSSSLSPSSPSA